VSDIAFVFDSFRYFEPVEFFENRRDVLRFWGFNDSTGESIVTSLEAVYLRDIYFQEKRIAVGLV